METSAKKEHIIMYKPNVNTNCDGHGGCEITFDEKVSKIPLLVSILICSS